MKNEVMVFARKLIELSIIMLMQKARPIKTNITISVVCAKTQLSPQRGFEIVQSGAKYE